MGSTNTIIYNAPGLVVAYNTLHETEKLEKREMVAKNNTQYAAARFKKEIQLSDITFSYSKENGKVLDGLNMTIKKGISIGLIGSSGAGKTTLSDASIRRNVAFGIEEDQIDDIKVWRALEMAQLKPFVEGLKNGLDTRVGEWGVKFSGGQRQRVAIARALYSDPDVLVMDEATAVLDNETEKAVMESIEALPGIKTLIIVAHRLTTVKKCDEIYEITGGKAVLRTKEEVFGNE